ncbi:MULTISPECIES: transposase [Kitasatospora]|uniref:Transposase n=1 Tax=Kitasatospora cathayae TaxID=3004092 RepID=A0ABY7QBF9_9ACTN|nr:transposase [Kitasatospora sp. HUAS 3-15]WBP89956.1 transposase [Kitasatospora sp. HUAS 3-15]
MGATQRSPGPRVSATARPRAAVRSRAALLPGGDRVLRGSDLLPLPPTLPRPCGVEPFIKLQRTIVRHRGAITAAADHRMSNGIVESLNTRIHLITRMAFGFKDSPALIALVLLTLGSHRPYLPGRHTFVFSLLPHCQGLCGAAK